MVFKRRDGLGQDEEMVRMRRRPLIMTVIIGAGAVICMLTVFLLLQEGKGSLLVMTDQPGAVVVLNGSNLPTPPGVLIKGLRADTYNVTVSKPGFAPEPVSQIITLKAGDTAKLSFLLRPQSSPPPDPPKESAPERTKKPSLIDAHAKKESLTSSEKSEPISETKSLKPTPQVTEKQLPISDKKPSQGSLKIVTNPSRGGIYVDEIFRGSGLAELSDLRLGEVVVRFGELEGYRTPAPQKVFLSPDKPAAQVEGLYLPIIFISGSLDASGRASVQKSSLTSGYVMEDTDPRVDGVAGPEIKYLEETRAFAWEMGPAFTNRNPPGQDFIELSFDLPDHFDGLKPLELRLYGYSSEKRYPFIAGGRTSFDVVINDRVAFRDATPVTSLAKGGNGFDVFSVNNFLRAGKNSIRIQSSRSSKCYYYLYKLVLM